MKIARNYLPFHSFMLGLKIHTESIIMCRVFYTFVNGLFNQCTRDFTVIKSDAPGEGHAVRLLNYDGEL